jgi:protein disulfide-isomerase A1
VAASVLVATWLLFSVHGFEWPSLGLGPTISQHATDELNADNFDDYMKDKAVVAILFYAPWCFYSQQVMPSWDLAGQKLKIHEPPVHLAKIDAHRYGSIGDRYGVNAFPTMKLFIDGTVFEYDNGQGRGWQQIVKWVNRHIDRDHVLKSVEDSDHYLNDNELTVIGLFDDTAVEKNSSIFVKSARHFDDISFAEARGNEISTAIAAHIARHATLVCETIDIGQSADNAKKVDLPRDHMHCGDTPKNPQRPEWSDKYKSTVEGKQLSVQRLDEQGGWQQFVQMRCCDEETEDHKAKMHDVPVPSIVMFMPHDERFAKYDGDMDDIHQLDKWISARRAPMVQRLSGETAEKIMDSGPDKTPVLFLITNSPKDPLEDVMREAAKTLRGRVLVALSGLSSPIEKRLADLAGADEEQLPVVTLIDAHGGGGGNYHSSKKYRLDTNGLTVDTIVKFIGDYEAGRLKPWLRSEAVTKEDMLGPVGVLVGSNFREVAQDTETDVLIDFYAPWCGHCRKFEPNYKALGKKLQHVKTVKILKLDATRNEVEGMMIQGFPTIILFKAGETPARQVHYSGNRQPEDMVQWLHQHCHIPFDDRPPVEATTAEPVSGLLDEFEEADL